MEGEPVPDDKRMRLRYSGTCRVCSVELPAKAEAIYERSSKTVRCLTHDEATDESPGTAARMRDQFKALQAAYGGSLTGNLPKFGIAYAEGVYLRLEHRANHWWCVYEPFTWIDVPRDPSPEVERAAADWRRERWAGRYNKTWANIIDAWATLFTAGTQTTVRSTKLNDAGGVAAEFVLSPTTGWARPAGVLADHSGGRS